MNEFKVGDKVKCIGDNRYHDVGDVDIITSLSEFGECIRFNGDNMGYFTYNYKLANYPNPPHKHVKEMIAFAEGAIIQYKQDMVWFEDVSPTWCEGDEFRIKPEKTSKQLEIERIESEIRKLADDLKAIKWGAM